MNDFFKCLAFQLLYFGSK